MPTKRKIEAHARYRQQREISIEPHTFVYDTIVH